MNNLFFLNNGGKIIQDMKNELKEIRAYNSDMASQITNGINKELIQMTTVLDNKIGGITSGINRNVPTNNEWKPWKDFFQKILLKILRI